MVFQFFNHSNLGFFFFIFFFEILLFQKNHGGWQQPVAKGMYYKITPKERPICMILGVKI